MTFTLFNQIATAFYNVFGGSMLLPIAIIVVIAMILLSIRAGKVVFFMVLVPIITTFFTIGVSKFFDGVSVGTEWVAPTMWLVIGLIMAGLFWKILQ